ncbi:hypothetical protein [Nocardioides marmoribigeumensis]|uniref:WD40 repeat domain-containing protein n=1 Tax=Nocardioides marmoribigeumensis TaxID=433649 RepID=A0ABU2BRA6_9ACTN|nr:hypothetical protein [Nocardioides marmoribigeumensis]MDR7361143.1 hypothetical protein [Nocardioides marmoribigeumensis]
MDIDLKQGLGEIADDARVAHLAADPLWRQGIQRRNRRRAGTVAGTLAVLALVAGVVGIAATPGRLRTEQAPPAAALDETHLPDRVWMPSPWTPGTNRAGDPGRIAVLFWDNGRRRSSGGADGGGWVSVSAVDGKYRYLDLPDLLFDGSDAPVLSPDGRYLAYPLRTAGADDASAGVSRGWAVYDAQTGRVRRHLPEGTPKGVGQGAIVWGPDSRVLLLDVCRVTEVTRDSLSCETKSTDVWDVTTDRHSSMTGAFASEVVGRSGDDLLLRSGRRLDRLDVRTARAEPLGRTGSVPDNGLEATFVDRAGTVATMATAPQSQGPNDRISLQVARQQLGEGAPVAQPRTLVSEVDSIEPLEVTADGRVLALMSWRGGPTVVARVDSTAPSSATDLVRFVEFRGALPQVATDLAAVPTVAGVRPPDVRDPRLVGGGTALLLAAVAGVGLLWRRRCRRLRGVGA